MKTAKTATVADLRNHFAILSKWIDEGNPVTITKHGTLFATLVPAQRKKKIPRVDRMARLRKIFLKGPTKGDVQDIINYERGDT